MNLYINTGLFNHSFSSFHMFLILLSEVFSNPLTRDAYFTLFVDIHPGKVCPFYSIYLTNWEKLPIFGHFYPGRVFYFAVKYSPLHLSQTEYKAEPECGKNVYCNPHVIKTTDFRDKSNGQSLLCN